MRHYLIKYANVVLFGDILVKGFYKGDFRYLCLSHHKLELWLTAKGEKSYKSVK